MKRVIAVLLVWLLVLPLCMVTAFAADTGYSFDFLEDFGDRWDVIGDNILDGKYMVEYWVGNALVAYTTIFEYKKENCISRWDTGLLYYSPFMGGTEADLLYILYNPSDDKLVVTVPDPCSFDAVDTPSVEVRFVPITPESPLRLFFSSYQDGMFVFVSELIESGVYSFVLRVSGADICYRSEPVLISFTEDPSGIYAQIANAETYVIVENEKIPLIIEVANTNDVCFIGMRIAYEVDGPFYVEVERVAGADGENDSVVNQFSTIANSFFETIGRIAAKIVSEPLLLLTVGIFFIGGCIALFGRILRRE